MRPDYRGFADALQKTESEHPSYGWQEIEELSQEYSIEVKTLRDLLQKRLNEDSLN